MPLVVSWSTYWNELKPYVEPCFMGPTQNSRPCRQKKIASPCGPTFDTNQQYGLNRQRPGKCAPCRSKAELDQPTLTIDPLEILNLPCTLAKNAITSTSVLAQLSTSTSTIKDFAIRMR